jgi:site-specific DNA-methyltransferase (cytosine-N4-specific)
MRAKDSVNTVWWFSKTEWPKADVSNVLTEYSDRMRKLLADPEGFYKPKKRPSGHDISKGFGTDKGGAIPSNLIKEPFNLLEISNSESNGQYLTGCKLVEAPQHPARFPARLPQFFIRMLTEPGDLVVDIFAGSNTTGWVAEAEKRRWLAFDENRDYLAASAFRFLRKSVEPDTMREIHAEILKQHTVDLTHYGKAGTLLETAIEIDAPAKPAEPDKPSVPENQKLFI